MAAAEPKTTVVLKTLDGQEFEVERHLAEQSQTIKTMMEDVGDDGGPIPLPNISSAVLAKVIEYWKHHADGGDTEAFDAELVKDAAGQEEIFELVMAANYLDTKALFELTCQAIADHIKDMTVEQVRDYFGIENDFTPEEEAKTRADNRWLYEDK